MQRFFQLIEHPNWLLATGSPETGRD